VQHAYDVVARIANACSTPPVEEGEEGEEEDPSPARSSSASDSDDYDTDLENEGTPWTSGKTRECVCSLDVVLIQYMWF